MVKAIVLAPTSNFYYYLPSAYSLSNALNKLGLKTIFAGYNELAFFRRVGIRRNPLYIKILDRNFNFSSYTILPYIIKKLTSSNEIEYRNIYNFIKNNKIDVIITFLNYPMLVRLKKETGVRLILWSGDEIIYEGWFDFARFCDKVFCVSKHGLKLHLEKGIDAEYLPFAVDTDYFQPRNKERKYDVVFIGNNLHDRQKLFSHYFIPLIMKYNKKLHLFGNGWDKFKKLCSVHGPVFWFRIPDIYSRTKIALNLHRFFHGVNLRTFEALACKTFLLCNEVSELYQFFRDKEDVVVYKSSKELLELAEYYLNNEEERNKIAEKGYKKVLSNHTINHRAKVIYEVIKKTV